MVEVSASLVRGMLAMARSAGLAVEPLVAGLPFDTVTIDDLQNVRWDHYCTVVERFEEACGGPAGHIDTVAKHHPALLSPEVRRLMAGLVSPEALLWFVIRTLCPHSFPTVDFECTRERDGRFRVSGRLRPEARPCAAWFRGSVPYMRHVTAHLGLPPSEVEVLELTESSLVFLMQLPPSRTLAARLRRRAKGAFAASVEVMRQFAVEARQRSVELLAIQAKQHAIAALGRDLARHQDLESLAPAIVEGLEHRGWNRVALWVIPLGQRTPSLACARGERGSYPHTVTLEVAGQSVGTLELAGTGDVREVVELSSWLSICIDNARTFMAIGEHLRHDPSRIAGRLAALGRSRTLTQRQCDILARVVRGCSNKEIAAELACAENTVEHHVTQLFRKTGTSGRTQLAAWFWSSATEAALRSPEPGPAPPRG